MTRIFVVDTETTGLDGVPAGDLVLDIGIVRVDTVTGEVLPAYSKIVGYNVDDWDYAKRNAWIFGHSDLTLDDVRDGVPVSCVSEDVRTLLAGNIATAYNVPFDFGKFLRYRPWAVSCHLAPDIMIAAHNLVDGEYEFEDGSTSWPRLEKAYSQLCPTDPAGLNGVQKHRALSDAMAAAHVMLRLVNDGIYPREVTA
ncbi:hypothetical protein AUQ37_03930 [Candidatus Methanomethylophilus sp. 1R26]|uniref:3'-5' exonuclease n=1 Tax=Candidatus Methanomethylophilus sp. 1R26 TaxID=1769296 RepID=UPI0007376116|nr:3'-5' exonuclease [Candidatus Methanomethylophilus sp. 1R26]KUE73019.1 hypothetical protein AUQ37_03930 [Candidatus Methanomethylophilus sp. 1R26]MEE3400592.1 3'-5' exonuclease [Methanomethylophilus sp.]